MESLKVVNMPCMESANTGYVYVNKFISKYVKFGEYVYRCRQTMNVKPDTIALNSVQRRSENVLLGSHILVSKFETNVEEFRNVYIRAEWLIRDIEAQIPDLANIFRSYFDDHILSFGQQVVLHYQDNLLLCTVKTNKRGRITVNTDVLIEWQLN